MALSGQITVSSAGTAVQSSTTPPPGYDIAVKAHPDNAGAIWAGQDGAGDVTNANGFPLSPGEGVVVPDLMQYWFDASNSGDKVCWLAVAR